MDKRMGLLEEGDCEEGPPFAPDECMRTSKEGLYPKEPSDRMPAWGERNDTSTNRPSFPAERPDDLPSLPQLPRTLDYLSDWRCVPSSDNRGSSSRISFGSSLGEGRASLCDTPHNPHVPQPVPKKEIPNPFEEPTIGSVPHPPEPASIHGPAQNDPRVRSEVSEMQDVPSTHLETQSTTIPPPVNETMNDVKRCNCQKSKCLKLYCDCYASGAYCVDCSCENCHNQPAYDSERKASWARIQAKNQSGILRGLPTVLAKEGLVGCNCTKSQCQQKYCYCFKKGLRCSQVCKCSNCKNPLGGDKGEAVVPNTDKVSSKGSSKKGQRTALPRTLNELKTETSHQTASPSEPASVPASGAKYDPGKLQG